MVKILYILLSIRASLSFRFYSVAGLFEIFIKRLWVLRFIRVADYNIITENVCFFIPPPLKKSIFILQCLYQNIIFFVFNVRGRL